MAEFDNDPRRPAVDTHPKGCSCAPCRQWYDRTGKLSGRCQRCGYPLGTHKLDARGIRVSCPAPRIQPA